MPKTAISLVMILAFLLGHSQEIVLEKKLPEEFKIKRTFQIPNRTNGNLGLFFFNKKESKAFLFDDSMKEISAIDFSGIPNKYSSPLGGIITNKNRFVFITSNGSADNFALGLFDFENKSASFTESVVELKKEKYLQHFGALGKFYLLTVNNRSSVLNIYEFDNEGSYSKHVIDLASTNFRHWNNNIVPLTTLLNSPFGKAVEIPLQRINADTPNSLEITASASKLFIENDKLYLALESNRSVTQTIAVDLNDFSHKTTTFNKPFLPNINSGKKSNSFIYDEKYFGLTGTNGILKLEIKDFSSREIINSYEIKKNEELPFKDASIYFEGKGLGSRSKIIDNTNRFLRTMSKQEVGITVYKQDGNNVITIGSFEKGVAGFGIGYNRIAVVYSYATTKSTFIKGMFNDNYDYIPGEVQPNTFDSLKSFIDENGKGSNEDFKESSDGYLYGTYQKKSNSYIIRRFQ